MKLYLSPCTIYIHLFSRKGCPLANNRKKHQNVGEKNWPIFMGQIFLLKSYRVSFYVLNKTCHIRKIAGVDEAPRFSEATK